MLSLSLKVVFFVCAFRFCFWIFFHHRVFFPLSCLKCEKCRRRLPRTYVKEKGLYEDDG